MNSGITADIQNTEKDIYVDGPNREVGRSEFSFEKIHQAVLNIGLNARADI